MCAVDIAADFFERVFGIIQGISQLDAAVQQADTGADAGCVANGTGFDFFIDGIKF